MRWPRSGQSPTLLLFLAISMSDLTMDLGTPAWSAARASLTVLTSSGMASIVFAIYSYIRRLLLGSEACVTTPNSIGILFLSFCH